MRLVFIENKKNTRKKNHTSLIQNKVHFLLVQKCYILFIFNSSTLHVLSLLLRIPYNWRILHFNYVSIIFQILPCIKGRRIEKKEKYEK